MRKLSLHVLTVVVLLFACSSLAHAQATRTWVSGVGDDANPCSRTAPCKTFAGAYSRTAAAGEINVLDPGGFGAVTIGKSLTISSEGFEAGVLVSGTNAIVINAGAGDTVVLRGLDIEGLGTSLSGIRVLGVGALHIEKCTINGFRASPALGIDIEPTLAGTEEIFIKDTIVRANGTGSTGGGILIAPAAGVTVKASLDNVRMDGNVFGLKTQGSSNTTVNNSVATGNSFAGFSTAPVGAPVLTIEHSMSSHNGTGVGCAAGTTVRIGGMSIMDNPTAVTSAACFSFKNNDMDVAVSINPINPSPQ